MFVYSSNGMGYKKVIYYLLGTNWIKTVWINFFYFPFNQALHLPILVSYHTSLSLSGGGRIMWPNINRNALTWV